MPLRFILRYLSNNEQLIRQMAESYPMRRAAQLTVALFYKGKAIGENATKQLKDSDITRQAKSIQQTFTEDVKQGFKELKKDIEQQQKKR